jgi:DNA-binding CsgD family transcriptional regulator
VDRPCARRAGPVAGRASDAFALTPTEEQVATIVSDGNTNHEIATLLFISVETVEADLTRIDRKVGVSSRRELARRIQDNAAVRAVRR